MNPTPSSCACTVRRLPASGVRKFILAILLGGVFCGAAPTLSELSAQPAPEAGVVAQAEDVVAAEVVSETGSRIGLSHYLVVSALTFGLGLLIVITRRSTIAVLMGVELLMNSAGLNFVAFAKFSPLADRIDGQVVTLFLIVIAAAEAALALAIALNIFNTVNSVEVDDARTLKG